MIYLCCEYSSIIIDCVERVFPDDSFGCVKTMFEHNINKLFL